MFYSGHTYGIWNATTRGHSIPLSILMLYGPGVHRAEGSGPGPRGGPARRVAAGRPGGRAAAGGGLGEPVGDAGRGPGETGRPY